MFSGHLVGKKIEFKELPENNNKHIGFWKTSLPEGDQEMGGLRCIVHMYQLPIMNVIIMYCKQVQVLIKKLFLFVK